MPSAIIEEPQKECAQKLYDAFHNFGWIYLKDFGISAEEIDEMFAWSKKYFDRPIEAKMKEKVVSTFIAQGYTADGAESSLKGAVSHKECYEHSRFVNNNCPPPRELDGFKEFVDGFYTAGLSTPLRVTQTNANQKCFELCKHVLKALAIIEGNMDPEYFAEPMKNANPQLRLLHYMGIQRKTLEAEGHWRINPHCDYGLCTILFQDAVGGLEVDPDHSGKFLPVTPVRGTCVINVADLLQRLSNNRLKSTRHRVTLPQMTEEQKRTLGPDDYLPPRYSTAFFVHPAPSHTVAPILLPGEPPSEYEPVNAGEWREGVTRRNYTGAHLTNKIIKDEGKPLHSQVKAL
ncbi:uncharacterized protein PAC_18090 [Phialocephala subalpina]|uniref:Fe2OG dioxygenase domain-containing protein n=1 Tax=Phialocephala subalpina TaxID=576137 RepID=A0A1L7XT39_9HELO|nr:uncharacterized protein PAC_18090 [Phialocephala subalpina]